MVSIKELAEACGVSVSAASKAMNYQKGIGREKAELVRRKAKEMGYHPNAAARTMRTNRSKNIGILYNNSLAHEYFSLVFEAVRQRAEELGYDITFLNGNPNGGMTYYEHAKNRQCDGVIVLQGDFDNVQVEELAAGSIPVVTIDQVVQGKTAVVGNNFESMKQIVHFLAARGHSRIAFIHGEQGNVTAPRLAGFYQGCRECGIEVPDDFVIAARFREPDDSALATERLLAMKQPPTCILYPDDVASVGGLRAAAELGLKIPADVSVFGYDGIRLASMLQPRLATYRQNAAGIGAAAVEQLIAEIEEPRGFAPQIITVNGEIMEGETVCRI